MFEFLTLPFMQRALVGGAVVAAVLAALGVVVVLRRMAFFGDGIAHASLAGVAIGLLTGFAPLPSAIIFSALLAVIIYLLERKTSLASDVAIGIIFTTGMAAGIMAINLQAGYQPELLTFLLGNILAVTTTELVLILVVALVIAAYLVRYYRAVLLLSLDPEAATLAGVKRSVHELVLYVLLALATVAGVKLVGIVLVSALLIVPAATAKLFARSLTGLMTTSVVLGVLMVLVGTSFSYWGNLPTGATVVLTGAAMFFLTALFRTARRRA